MELNQKQIEYLFKFVDEKGVKYYDVQHEIVDHLASSIESEIMENKNTSFEHALHIVYSKYPITGFAQYTVDLEDSLWKFWLRRIFLSMTMGYGIPLIGLLLCLTYSLYYSIFSNGIVVVNTMNYGLLALGFLAFITFGKQFGRSAIEMMIYSEFLIVKDDLNKRLMYYQVLKNVTSLMIIIPIFLSRVACDVVSNSQTNVIDGSPATILILSLLSSIAIYWSLAVIFYFPAMIKDVIAEKYNHVVIA